MKFLNSFILPAAIMVGLFAGCDAVTSPGNASLTLHVEPHVNGEPLMTDSTVTYDMNGVAVSFESARIYLTDITLIENIPDSEQRFQTVPGTSLTVPAKDGEGENISHTVEENVLLIKHDTGMESHDLGTWTAGSFEGIRFKVGIGGTTNRIDPSQVPADHPLAKQTDRNNHWNWNAGYLYLRIDGYLDTDDDSIMDDNWAVHLGTERFLKEVTLMHDFTIEDGESVTLELDLDYGKFLQNVDFSNPEQRICHTMNNPQVANAVGDQITSAFEFGGRRE